MEPPEVLYCVEHLPRELDIACAIRAIARQEYGINIRIHPLTNDIDPAIEGRKFRLIAVPSCTSREFAHREIFQKWTDVPVLNLAFEQLLSPANRRYRLPRDEFARHHVLHLAAGEFFRQWLIDTGVPSQNIVLTGSATFQLYRHPYRHFYESRRDAFAEAHQLDPNLPWIFLPENFIAAFFKPSHIRKRIRGGYDRKELAAYVDYARKSFCQIARWCHEAAATGRVEMIIRPRPAVSRTAFVEAFRDVIGGCSSDHLHFIKDGNVREWILASQLVVSSYSTTLLEAAMAGKPAYLLGPCSPPMSASSDWHRLAPTVSTRDEFLALLGDLRSAGRSDELARWVNRNLLNYGDAIENVARTIHELCSGARTAPMPYQRPLSRVVVGAIRETLKKGEHFLRQRLHPQRRQNFVYEHVDIDSDRIEQQTDLWASILQRSRIINGAA